MRRPKLPAQPMIPASSALPPSCYRHGPYGSTGYCPACAAARIDTARTMHPEIRIDYPPHHRGNALLAAATLVGAVVAAGALSAVLFLMTGVLTWH